MINWIKRTLNLQNDRKLPEGPLVIAVDFDGTCVQHRYPFIGEEMPGASRALHSLVEHGHTLILWTCREDDPQDAEKNYLTQAMKWFEDREIPVAGFNKTPEEHDFRPHGGRKVAAHLYIDDAIVGGFPGWPQIHLKITGKTLLK